jgi:hypothetical protein
MFSSPLAFALTLGSGLLIVAIALAVGRSHQGHGGAMVCPDPECGHANPPNARYCAQCGRKLTLP